MISKQLQTIPTHTPGVYCMYDLDEEPAYVGKSGDLRSRLRQHFIRQDSSVVSYGRLDIWDIASVDWWEATNTDRAEIALISEFNPYLNFESDMTTLSDTIDAHSPDGTMKLISEEEQEFRSDPYHRSKQKLEHLLRMIDKIKLAGHSDDTKKTLEQHQRIFSENVAEFLDVEPMDEFDGHN